MRLSQARVAERAGIDVQTVRKWEKGRTKTDIESLAAVAKAEGTEVIYFLNSIMEELEKQGK